MTEPIRWRMMGYMAALFIAGGITGAAVMSQSSTGSQTLKVGRSEEIARLIMQKLDPLGLTTDQRQKFEPLVRKASEELEASHVNCLEQCATIVDKLHGQMSLDLTPEQRQTLQQLEGVRREIMRKKYNFTRQSDKAANP